MCVDLIKAKIGKEAKSIDTKIRTNHKRSSRTTRNKARQMQPKNDYISSLIMCTEAKSRTL